MRSLDCSSVFSCRSAWSPVAWPTSRSLLLGVLVVYFINPQYVNVSALYLGSAFMMASILLLSQSYEKENEESDYLPSPILISLIYAALFTLKTNLPVFPAFQGVLFCIAMALSGVSVRRLARWSFSTVLLTLCFLSPWILLHLPHYLHRSPVPILNEIPASYKGELDLFSFSPLFYGGSIRALYFSRFGGRIFHYCYLFMEGQGTCFTKKRKFGRHCRKWRIYYYFLSAHCRNGAED